MFLLLLNHSTVPFLNQFSTTILLKFNKTLLFLFNNNCLLGMTCYVIKPDGNMNKYLNATSTSLAQFGSKHIAVGPFKI